MKKKMPHPNRGIWFGAARLTWAIRCATLAGTADSKATVSPTDRALIDEALAAGRVTRCPTGWHLGHDPKCLSDVGI